MIFENFKMGRLGCRLTGTQICNFSDKKAASLLSLIYSHILLPPSCSLDPLLTHKTLLKFVLV